MRRPQKWRDRTVSPRRSHALCRYFLESAYRKLTPAEILGGLALISSARPYHDRRQNRSQAKTPCRCLFCGVNTSTFTVCLPNCFAALREGM